MPQPEVLPGSDSSATGTAAGWRYIHWAESPMTGTMYLTKLMERDVDQEKFRVCHERSMQRWRTK